MKKRLVGLSISNCCFLINRYSNVWRRPHAAQGVASQNHRPHILQTTHTGVFNAYILSHLTSVKGSECRSFFHRKRGAVFLRLISSSGSVFCVSVLALYQWPMCVSERAVRKSNRTKTPLNSSGLEDSL